jgi:hypothetical protein
LVKKGEMASVERCVLREWQKNQKGGLLVNEAAALQFVRVLLGLLSPSTPSPREIATAERRALHKLFAWVFLDYSPHGCLSALLESATRCCPALFFFFSTFALKRSF